MFDVTDLPPAPWAKKPKPAKAEAKPPLTRQAIVDAALRIIDTEGLDAVSMRRIAQVLGTGAASLYAHVADKEELLDLVVDQIMGEIVAASTVEQKDPEERRGEEEGSGSAEAAALGSGVVSGVGPEPGPGSAGQARTAPPGRGGKGEQLGASGSPALPDPADWQEQLREMSRGALRVLTAHGDVARAFIGRIPFGPNGLVAVEAQLAVLRGAGMPDQMAAFAGDLLGMFVTGYAADEANWRGRFPNAGGAEMVEHLGQLRGYLEALPAERFPNVIAMAGSLLAGGSDELSRFELGLDVLVRGLSSFVPPPPPTAPPSPTAPPAASASSSAA